MCINVKILCDFFTIINTSDLSKSWRSTFLRKISTIHTNESLFVGSSKEEMRFKICVFQGSRKYLYIYLLSNDKWWYGTLIKKLN